MPSNQKCDETFSNRRITRVGWILSRQGCQGWVLVLVVLVRSSERRRAAAAGKPLINLSPGGSALLFRGDADDMNNQVQHFIVRDVDVEQVVNIVFDQSATFVRIRVLFGHLFKNKVIIGVNQAIF